MGHLARRPRAALLHGAMAVLVLGSACHGVGDSCAGDADCGGDLVCALPSPPEGLQDGRGVCVWPRGGPGEGCASSAECGAWLFCSNEVAEGGQKRRGVCLDVRGEGEACYRDEGCADGLVCAREAEEAPLGACAVPVRRAG